MRTVHAIRFAFSVCLLLAGGTALAQYGGVAIDSSTVSYDLAVQSLRSVDFKNLRYPYGGQDLELKNGVFHHKDEASLQEVRLEHVWYFDVQAGKRRHALAALSYLTCGVTCADWGLLYVFTIKDGHLEVAQRLDCDREVQGAGQSFAPGSGRLTIRARSDDDSAHCCPRHIDTVTFRWTGAKFEWVASHTDPVTSK